MCGVVWCDKNGLTVQTAVLYVRCPVSKCAACPCSVHKSSPARTCHHLLSCSLQNKNLLLILNLVITKCLDKSTVQ